MRRFFSTLPKMSILSLAFIPALIMHLTQTAQGIPAFLVAALGILGTVTLIGKSTQTIASYTGPLWGGLINATFGNVTELVIAITALQKTELHNLVRSSITGSILGNLLLVLGASMVYGGLKYPKQTISRTGASVNVGMLWMTVVCLLVPTAVHLAWGLDPQLDQSKSDAMLLHVSLAAALILLGMYILTLVFSLRTHRFEIMPASEEEEEPLDGSLKVACATLFVSTVVVALLGDFFVESLNYVLNVQHLAISPLFVGVVIVAVVGNAAEGSVAVVAAGQNKMELSYQIAMGSCLQIALMVTPILVLVSFAIGKPLTLAFNPFEMAALIGATVIASSSLQDGETNWLEGAMFLGVYLFFAIVFWYHP